MLKSIMSLDGSNPEKVVPRIIIRSTPEQIKISEISTKSQKIAQEKMVQSQTLADYLNWHLLYRYEFSISGISEYFRWIKPEDSFTARELVQDSEKDGPPKYVQNIASNIEILKPRVESIPPREGMVRVALKRVRDKGGRYDYHAIAIFPKGTNIYDATDRYDYAPPPEQEPCLYYIPSNACSSHSCDDLFREHRNNPFYIPYKDVSEAQAQLEKNQSGDFEYMLEKDESNKVTQSSENYLLVGLIGGFTNETNRVRVSDFFDRLQTKTRESQLPGGN